MAQFNIRDLPELTARQITQLMAQTGMTKTQLVITAIDRMYQQECTSQEAYMESQVVVTNPFRSRKFGFGYTCTPTGNGTEIETPSKPDYTGTLKQVQEAVDADRLLASFRSGGTFYNTAWFYDGRRIVGAKSGFGDYFSDWRMEADYARAERKAVKSVTLTLA